MLRTACYAEDGEQRDVALKAWTVPRRSGLRWSLDRVRQACGFSYKSKWTACCYLARYQWETWNTALQMLRWDQDLVFGKPLHSARQKGFVPDPEMEEEFWVKTCFMLAMVLMWSTQKGKSPAKRALAENVLRAALRRTMPAEFRFLEVPDASSFDYDCHLQPADGGHCAHIVDYTSKWGQDVAGVDHVEVLVQRLLYLWRSRDECPGVAQHLSDMLVDLGDSIDDRVHAWGDTEWVKSEDAVQFARHENRRPCRHVREFQTAEALRTCEATTLQAARGLVPGLREGQARRAIESEMAALRGTHMLAFHNPEVISLAWDGGNFSNPGKEMLVTSITEQRRRVHGSLLPQEEYRHRNASTTFL